MAGEKWRPGNKRVVQHYFNKKEIGEIIFV
jgi:hypothetical protein